MLPKIVVWVLVLALAVSIAAAEELAVISDKAENFGKLENIEGANIYAVMHTGLLIGVSLSGKAGLTGAGIDYESIGSRDNDSQYYLFQIDDRDIVALPVDVELLYYQNGEAIAKSANELEAQSLQLMKGTTRISFVPMQRAEKQPANIRLPLVTDEAIDEIVGQISQTEYTANVQRLQDFVTRYSSTDSCRAAENWAISRFAQLGLDTELFPYAYSSQTWYDAIGRQVGLVYPDSIYIIIAHIDATSESPQVSAPGAEDNGSGSACVLEAARVLSQYDFNCTIEYILVSGEEQGLYGSEAYADYCFTNQRHIGGVLNFDMIAYTGGAGWDINIFYDQTFPQETALANLLASLTDEYSSAISVLVGTDGPEYGSDHYYFSYYGFPAPFGIDAQLWSSPDWYPWYHSTSDVITNLDLDYATEVTKGAVATMATIAGLWSPPALLFSYPEGLPDLISPSGGTSITVEITPGTGNLFPGSVYLYYSEVDSFIATGLAPIDTNLYTASFHSINCGREVLYYLSAETFEGIVVTDPPDAPSSTYSAFSARNIAIAFSDSFNTDLGWTVQSSCSDGQWQRGIPAGGGDRGDPPGDYDGSGYCYVTGNEYGNSDVDSGYTWLISPSLDLGENDGLISYAIWYTNNFGDAPNSDFFKIYISNDDGSSWIIADSLGPHSSPGWNEYSLRVSDYVEPGGLIKVRFEAADTGSGSVVEAGVDKFEVKLIDCQPSQVGGVTGWVFDSNGSVEDVYVSLLGTLFSDSTDSNGHYMLDSIAPGIYDISFTHPDHRDTVVSGITVVAGNTLGVSMILDNLFVSYAYIPGDANMYNGVWPPAVIGSDVTYLVNFFRGLTTNPACLIDGNYMAADVNGSCTVIGSDVTRLVAYFRGQGIIEYCPDWPPAWLVPDDFPAHSPLVWPNCDEPLINGKISPENSLDN